MNRRKLGEIGSSIATVVLVACAVTITALVLRRELRSAPSAQVVQEVSDQEWVALSKPRSRIGRTDAALVLVEFADFQCPYCAEIEPVLVGLRQLNDFALEYRHFPIESIHPRAFEAAVAAECAGRQGRFAAFHDSLYQMQDSLRSVSWKTLAQSVGIGNAEEFQHCVDNESTSEDVRSDLAMGKSIGVAGTPTFVFNGRIVVGADSLLSLARTIESQQDSIAARQRTIESR